MSLKSCKRTIAVTFFALKLKYAGWKFLKWIMKHNRRIWMIHVRVRFSIPLSSGNDHTIVRWIELRFRAEWIFRLASLGIA